VLEHQARFAALALDRYPRDAQIVVAPRQAPRAQPTQVEAVYAVDTPEEAAEATHIVWGWLLGDTCDPRNLLEAHLMSGVLLEHSASPLRHALETTKLATAPSELCGLDDSARQLAFLCGVEGSDPAHAEALEHEVLAVVADVAQHGVPAPQLEAALDRIEMAQRDISGDGFPYGLQLMSRMLPAALLRADPVAMLDIDPLLAALRRDIAMPGYFPALVRRLLLENAHRVRVVMRPDLDRRAQEHAAEQARLTALAGMLDAAGRAQLAEQTAALAARQAQIDDPDVLPRITLADVPAAIPPVTGSETRLRGRSLHEYRRGTNGVVHAQWICDLPTLETPLLAVLPLFASMLLEFGVGRETYLETQARRAQVGSFAASALVRSTLTSLADHRGMLVVTAKGLRRHAHALSEVLQEALTDVRLDEHDRLRDLVAQTRADLDLSVTGRGHHLAMHGAARGLSASGWLSDLWDGPANLRALRHLDDHAEQDPAVLPTLFEHFAALRQRLLAAPPRLLLVGEDEALAAARAALEALPQAIAGTPPAFRVPAPAAARSAAWTINADVNFCAKAYPVVPEGHPDAPHLAVLGRYLGDGFLHPAIREKGGAYGSGASFDGDSGCFHFYSYRDPRCAGTLEDFDRALDWFAGERDPRRLEESILGVIRALDRPRSPAGAAIDAFYSLAQGRTPEFRADYRARVLATGFEDLHRVAARWLVPARGIVGVVTHRGEEATMRELGFETAAL
jgi:Zn-dependent M16 (insulinase) family peptidase